MSSLILLGTLALHTPALSTAKHLNPLKMKWKPSKIMEERNVPAFCNPTREDLSDPDYHPEMEEEDLPALHQWIYGNGRVRIHGRDHHGSLPKMPRDR